MRALFSALISKEPGLLIETAETGAEALEKVMTIDPAVIVLDMMLPDMNGLEILKRIAEQKGGTPPVLVVTAASTTVTPDEVIRGSFSGGIYEIFRKPINQAQFVNAIRECTMDFDI